MMKLASMIGDSKLPTYGFSKQAKMTIKSPQNGLTSAGSKKMNSDMNYTPEDKEILNNIYMDISSEAPSQIKAKEDE